MKFCELVEKLWCITALPQQDLHSFWKIKCKHLLDIIFITSKTIEYAIVYIINFHVQSTENSKFELKKIRIGRCGLQFVAQYRDQLLA